MRELRSIALCPLTPAAFLVAALGIAAVTGTGCVDQVDQYNQPGRITSIGPIRYDGSAVLIDYTVVDPEGDDQAIAVGVCPADDEGSPDCPTPVPGTGGDGHRSLTTSPRGEDVEHVLSWNVGCGRAGDGECPETDLETSYVADVSIEGSDETISSAPFSLADLGADEIPACDTSIRAIPDVCQPEDD